MFFTPLWRTIENSGGARRETVKDNNKVKSFSSVNYSNCANREKDKSNYCFSSIVKNTSQKGLKLSQVRREKWLAQIFRKDFISRES